MIKAKQNKVNLQRSDYGKAFDSVLGYMVNKRYKYI